MQPFERADRMAQDCVCDYDDDHDAAEQYEEDACMGLMQRTMITPRKQVAASVWPRHHMKTSPDRVQSRIGFDTVRLGNGGEPIIGGPLTARSVIAYVEFESCSNLAGGLQIRIF